MNSSTSEETWTARDARRPGHFWADNEVLDCYAKVIGVHAFAVYMALTRHVDGDGRCFPATATIADELGISRPTVVKAMQTLERHELVHIIARRLPVRGQTSNEYILLEVDKTAVNVVYSGGQTAVKEIDSQLDRCQSPLHPLSTSFTPPVNDVDSHINNTHVNKTQLRTDDVKTTAADLKKEGKETTTEAPPLTFPGSYVEPMKALGLTYGQAQQVLKVYAGHGKRFDDGEMESLRRFVTACPDESIRNPLGYLHTRFAAGQLVHFDAPMKQPPQTFHATTLERLPQPGDVPQWQKDVARRLLEETDKANAPGDALIDQAAAAALAARMQLLTMGGRAAKVIQPPGDYWRS